MGKTAFLFPGQSSQQIGMGKSLYENYAAARAVYSVCNADIIKEISWHGEREDLLPAKVAGRALFMADLAAAMALKDNGINADGAAGFSVGEVAAIAYSEIINIKKAYDFVCFRADVMQENAENIRGGLMAVFGLSSEAVAAVCTKVNGTWPACYNAPGQIIIAYDLKAESFLKETVYASKGKVLPLPTTGAFHSPLMNGCTAKVADYLAGESFAKPSIPVYSNVTATPYGSSNEAKALLSQQIHNPVQWQATIENMISDGFDTFIETGPGKTLTSIVKKINKDVRTFNVSNAETLENCLANV